MPAENNKSGSARRVPVRSTFPFLKLKYNKYLKCSEIRSVGLEVISEETQFHHITGLSFIYLPSLRLITE